MSDDNWAKLARNLHDATPMGIEELDILLRLVAAAKERVRSFACLGAELTLLSEAIREEHPSARGLLIHFPADTIGAMPRPHPLRNPDTSFAEIPASGSECHTTLARFAPLDAIVIGSELRISSHRRRKLFAEIFDVLNPGGIILSVGELPSPTRWTTLPMDDSLIEATFGEELRAGAGKSRVDIAHAYLTRVGHDKDIIAPLEVQCHWLRDAGFECVDCYMKTSELTVIGGQRPQNENG